MDSILSGAHFDSLIQQAKDEGYLHGYEQGYQEGVDIGYPEGYKLGRALGVMYRNLVSARLDDPACLRKRDKLLSDLLVFPRDNAEGIDRQQELHRLRAAYRELASSCPLPALEAEVKENKFDF